MFKHLKSSKGFTLIEMLIVIGILAVLVAVVVSILNPAEFFRQTRDSRRLSDLNQLDQALNLAALDNVSMGTVNVVYVSIPDGNTDATTTCSALGLPDISGSGMTYQCSNLANYRKVNGTGWVPVNFSALVTVPSALTLLPIDPTNATSSNLFYTYVSGSWELTSLFESTKYQTNYKGFGTSTVYTSGNHQGISPNGIATRSGVPPVPSVSPTLTTSAATNVTGSGATLNGSITNEGTASSTIAGFDYGLTTSYGSQVTSTYSGGTGNFSNAISGLSGSTFYHFRAKSYNSTGWGYGSDTTLTTTDPYTKLLLHGDGTNGSTSFTDSSLSAKTVTAHGNVQISTAQSKFGGASGYYGGSGYLTIPDSEDWTFGSGDFTIDFWMKTTASGNVWVMYQGGPGSMGGSVNILLNVGWHYPHKFEFQPGYSFVAGDVHSTTSVDDNTWHHIAIVKATNVYKLYVDGINESSLSLVYTQVNSSDNLVLSGREAGDFYFTGYLDEVRISKGIARWTSNFTPPTAPY